MTAMLLGIATLFVSLFGCAHRDPSASLSDEEKRARLEEAYIYTLPLMIMDATFAKMTNTVSATNEQAPTGQFIHALNLATADFENVVTPNVDTIYSQVFFDLSEDALILEFPKTERYCTVEILDAYTNCIKIIDAASFEKASEAFILTGKDFREEIPEGMEEIPCPTRIGWVIVRTICGSKEDAKNVHAIQADMKAYTLSSLRAGKTEEKTAGVYDPANDFIPVVKVLGMEMKEYFKRANLLMAENPPAAADAPLLERLAAIGVGPSLTFDETVFGEGRAALWQEMVSGITQTVTTHSMPFLKKNGHWSYMGEPIAEFGTEYAYRALISLVGLGANPVSVAVYPKTTVDQENNRLNGQNRYVLHFEKDALPKVKEFGFWSVTAYNSETDLLIDNEIDRYCINDRSDVSFNEDGSLDIFIQAEKPTDGIQNWLPVSEGDFHLVLRVYFPDESIVNNEWQAPMIEKQ